MRSQYQRNRDLMLDWVSRYFPAGTRASRPPGQLYAVGGTARGLRHPQAQPRPWSSKAYRIAVGSIFSASGKYRNCLRMNYAAKPTPQIEEAVRKVGATAIKMLAEAEQRVD
jgi:DNA-binding transcriptional MocR family regulator